MTELNPCPFCGGIANFLACEQGFRAHLFVRCSACYAKSASVEYSIRENDLTADKDPIPPMNRKEQVALYWNRRTTVDAARAAIAKVEGAS